MEDYKLEKNYRHKQMRIKNTYFAFVRISAGEAAYSYWVI